METKMSVLEKYLFEKDLWLVTEEGWHRYNELDYFDTEDEAGEYWEELTDKNYLIDYEDYVKHYDKTRKAGHQNYDHYEVKRTNFYDYLKEKSKLHDQKILQAKAKEIKAKGNELIFNEGSNAEYELFQKKINAIIYFAKYYCNITDTIPWSRQKENFENFLKEP